MSTTHNIPCGYPYNAAIKLQRKTSAQTTYTDITDPDDVPSSNWALHWVDTDNRSQLRQSIDWSTMDEQGYVLCSLTAAQTTALQGSLLHLEIRNNDIVSDLLTQPDDRFLFISNDIQ